jgi:hypothetical protein
VAFLFQDIQKQLTVLTGAALLKLRTLVTNRKLMEFAEHERMHGHHSQGPAGQSLGESRASEGVGASSALAKTKSMRESPLARSKKVSETHVSQVRHKKAVREAASGRTRTVRERIKRNRQKNLDLWGVSV